MSDLQHVYETLYNTYGPQHWWPGQSPFETVVGAILTQNTAWSNVELALEELREHSLLSLDAMRGVDVTELAEHIRSSGYFRQKAQRLNNLIAFVDERYGGSLVDMFADDLVSLREGLLSVKGIGPETADSILLYAGDFPTFVVDAYTARIVKRHAWIEPEADYYAIKEFFESQLPREASLFNEYHALIVRIGKEFCRTTPRCERCPLACLLPESGPADWKA